MTIIDPRRLEVMAAKLDANGLDASTTTYGAASALRDIAIATGNFALADELEEYEHAFVCVRDGHVQGVVEECDLP